MQCFPNHLLSDHLCMFTMQTLKLLLFPLISSHILLLQFLVSTKQCVSNILPFTIAVRHVRKVLCYIWLLGSYSILPFNSVCILKIKESLPLVSYKPFSYCHQGKKNAFSFHFLFFWFLHIQRHFCSPHRCICISQVLGGKRKALKHILKG